MSAVRGRFPFLSSFPQAAIDLRGVRGRRRCPRLSPKLEPERPHAAQRGEVTGGDAEMWLEWIDQRSNRGRSTMPSEETT